jgi:hypothetical protein
VSARALLLFLWWLGAKLGGDCGWQLKVNRQFQAADLHSSTQEGAVKAAAAASGECKRTAFVLRCCMAQLRFGLASA